MSSPPKPFGLEFLEAIRNPTAEYGEQHNGAECCTTWMSDISGPGDVGAGYTCVNGVDNPCCDGVSGPCS